MRILIAGALGQLGSDLARLCPQATTHDLHDMPIQDEAALLRIFAEERPELVFNCAAYNAVDRAESEPEKAIAANASGPGVLASVCARLGVRLIHYSTNYVFDGRADRPYTEADEPNPLGAYARSKLAGERAVLDALPDALVIRGAGLFGVRGSQIKGGSFPERILHRAASGEPLRVVADQRLNPTYTADLASASLRLAASGLTGVVHVVPLECASWYEFAVETLRLAGVDAPIQDVRTGESGAGALRPLNGCMTSTRVEPLRSWKEGLQDYVRARYPGRP